MSRTSHLEMAARVRMGLGGGVGGGEWGWGVGVGVGGNCGDGARARVHGRVHGRLAAASITRSVALPSTAHPTPPVVRPGIGARSGSAFPPKRPNSAGRQGHRLFCRGLAAWGAQAIARRAAHYAKGESMKRRPRSMRFRTQAPLAPRGAFSGVSPRGRRCMVLAHMKEPRRVMRRGSARSRTMALRCSEWSSSIRSTRLPRRARGRSRGR